MWPLIKNSIKKFLFDEQAAKRWMRGFFLWAGGMGVSVLAYPYEQVMAWTAKEWGYRLLAAGMLGVAGTIGVGQKNPSPEEIKAIAGK